MNDAVKYIHSKSWVGSVPGLSRTRELLKRLSNPEKSTKFIHVAGTNGKGSTAQFLSSVLIAAGYKTGLYTSPFIHNFNERIKIDNVNISDESLAALVDVIKIHAEAMEPSPTEFELITACAFLHFAEEQCDVVVLEVGMGGLFDSTNVIESPLCSVITNIGLDHIKALGNTIEEIALQKAGIIKKDCPTVLYKQGDEVTNVVRAIAEREDSPFFISEPGEIKSLSGDIDGQHFSYQGMNLFIRLLGEHQIRNVAVALKTIGVLRGKGFDISDDAVKSGLSTARWPARFEVLSKSPYFILDGGHNAQCAVSVAEGLVRYFPGKKVIFVIGVLKEKELHDILKPILPLADEVFTVSPNFPRALGSGELADTIRAYNIKATACDSIKEGIESALRAAGEDGVICAFGSLYITGEFREFFGLFH